MCVLTQFAIYCYILDAHELDVLTQQSFGTRDPSQYDMTYVIFNS